VSRTERKPAACAALSVGGSAPKPPGFCRFAARILALLRNWGLRPRTPNGAAGGRRFAASPLFRPLSRRSGCVPAEPYPPLSRGPRLRRSPEKLKLCVSRQELSHSILTGCASYSRDHLGAFVPAAQHDFGTDDPVIGGRPTLK